MYIYILTHIYIFYMKSYPRVNAGRATIGTRRWQRDHWHYLVIIPPPCITKPPLPNHIPIVQTYCFLIYIYILYIKSYFRDIARRASTGTKRYPHRRNRSLYLAIIYIYYFHIYIYNSLYIIVPSGPLEGKPEIRSVAHAARAVGII